jgi:hypothetical protein
MAIQRQLAQSSAQQRAADALFGTQFGRAQTGSQEALDLLKQQATGTAPSAAALQMQQGLEAAIAAQHAQAASARGMTPAMASHLAAQNIGTLQQQAVAQGAQLRAQEQAQAQESYAGAQGKLQGQLLEALQGQQRLGIVGGEQQLGALGGMRGQDISSAGQNLAAMLQTMGLGAQGEQFAIAGGLSLEEQEYLRAQQANARANVPYDALRGAILETGGQLIAGAATGGGGAKNLPLVPAKPPPTYDSDMSTYGSGAY